MESHESAGIPEEEYARLRRRTILHYGGMLGGIWMTTWVNILYGQHQDLKLAWLNMLGAAGLALLGGWLAGSCFWGMTKEALLEKYKKRRELQGLRKPIGPGTARTDLILGALGLMVVGLDLWLSSRTLKDYMAPSAFAGALVAVMAVVRLVRRETEYRRMTNAPGLDVSITEDLLLWVWVWVGLILSIPFGVIPLIGAWFILMILFYPLDRALTLRSQREFGGDSGSAAEA